MSSENTKYSLKPTARRLIAFAFTVCVNVLLFLMVNALFGVDLTVTGGGVLA
jgi:hypothetical protein